jgi:hypothetical protein
MRPSALKRLKDTYKGDDRILPSLQRHVMRAMADDGANRRHDVMHPSEMSKKGLVRAARLLQDHRALSEKESLANPPSR